MTIKTTHTLSENEVTRLQEFKALLQDNIIKPCSEGMIELVDEPGDSVSNAYVMFRDMAIVCQDYITQIDALLGTE